MEALKVVRRRIEFLENRMVLHCTFESTEDVDAGFYCRKNISFWYDSELNNFPPFLNTNDLRLNRKPTIRRRGMIFCCLLMPSVVSIRLPIPRWHSLSEIHSHRVAQFAPHPISALSTN